MVTVKTAGILSESNRARILRSLAEVCVDKGYRETTVEQVVERAGVSSDDFYDLFSDKEQCTSEAVSATISQILAEVSGTYTPGKSEWDSGIIGMKAILEMMAANPSIAHLTYIASRQMATPDVFAVYESGVMVLSGMIARLWKYSDLDWQPSGTARAALGCAETVVRREIAAGRTEQILEVLPDLVYGVTVPFVGQKQALQMARRARDS